MHKKETAVMAQNITKSSKVIVKDALAAVPAISVDDVMSLVESDTQFLFICGTAWSKQNQASSRALLLRRGA
jgi:hypothetical protein